MQHRSRSLRLLFSLIAVILVLVFITAAFVAGAAADRSGIIPGAPVQEPTVAGKNITLLWQAWSLVDQHYVERSAIDPKKMTYGAVEGMLDSLGDQGHTRFLSPEDLKAEEQALSGKLEGIGAQLGIRNGAPTVVAPIAGSPAQRAGVRSGDIIVRVDGKDVEGLSLDQIVNMIRGPAGTKVTLSVIHSGETVITDIAIVRANINVPNVAWSMVPGTTVAHVLVSQFGDGTKDELVTAIKAAQARGATGIVFDLRNDPGGLRDQAVAVGSQFLRSGNVLLERDAQGKETQFPVQPGGVALDIPMSILINEGTASSAEIVAGALQDDHRGPLIGEQTFGTGTVLSSFPLSDGSAVLLGTEEWLTPAGRQIWHHGIVPDIKVALPNGVVPLIPDQETSMTPSQFKAANDVQLQKAVAQLSGGGTSH